MTDEDWAEMFEERAAIFEYCAGFSRPEAERKASEVIRIEKLKQPTLSTEQQTSIPGMEANMEFI